MKRILFIFVVVFLSSYSYSQTYWKIESENGEQILITLLIHEEKHTFEAFTREDALKDIAGSLIFSLAKTTGRLEYPEIVFIAGSTSNKNDSLILSGTFTYFDKQYPFHAAIRTNTFIGKYIDNRNRPHRLNGVKVSDNHPIKNYPEIINSAFILTEKYLLNSEWIRSEEWLDFKKEMTELKSLISDDFELAAAFYWLGKKLPFSPLEISKVNPNRKTVRETVAGLREIKFNTCFFDQNSLPVSKREMDSIGLVIEKKGYKNLVVDLRGNNRIFPETVMVLLNYISPKSFYPGAFLSRNWFDSNKTPPKQEEYIKLLKGFSVSGKTFESIYPVSGRYLGIVPAKKTFTGKVYILTDTKTSRVAESLVYILKKEKIATIVGQKTSGNSLITEKIPVNSEYTLNFPVSDFFNSEGKSINKVVIEPDIPVNGEDPLNFILRTLI